MGNYLAPVYKWASFQSRFSTIAVILIYLLFDLVFGPPSISFQLVLAVFALALGIPHGAIDHLVAIPRKPNSRFVIYILVYTLIAVLAGWLISSWNIFGFQAVLVMSALHFGFGDASYGNEMRSSKNLPPYKKIDVLLYGLAAGIAPVFLPLTDIRATSALKRIHPNLINWANGSQNSLRHFFLYYIVISIVLLAIKFKIRLALDLTLIFLLSWITPPLVAFACYFGLWHALRHTARLVPKYEKSKILAVNGLWWGAITRAFFAGIYALVGTILLALILMIFLPGKFSSSFFWSALLIVWALTVPHMITTAKFDRISLFHLKIRS